MKWVAIFLVLIAVGLAGAYWWAGKDEIPLTDAERSAAPGQFVELSAGKIHYVARGPETGPVIVMVHGFSTPHFIFEQNASSLAANGFRVIQFDHFGRGWSDRPNANYDADFYDTALIELLDALEIKEPVGLIGLSMGGVITAEFTARHPERVERLFLLVTTGLSVSGMDSLQTSLAKSPILGDWLWRVTAKQTLLNDEQMDEEHLPEMNRLQGDLEEQMKYSGYFPALLSTLRHLEMTDRDATFEAVAQTAIPVLAVFGDSDPIIPIESAAQLREIIPSADVRELSGANHQLNYQDFEIINPWMIEFFSTMLPSPIPEGTSETAVDQP